MDSWLDLKVESRINIRREIAHGSSVTISCISFSSERRAQYKEYLKETGVMEKVVKAMTSLYELPEKPEDPVGYIAQYLRTDGKGMGPSCGEKEKEIETLEAEVKELEEKLTALKGAEEKAPAEGAPAEGAEPAADGAAPAAEGEAPAEGAPVEGAAKPEGAPAEGEAKPPA
ncbi:hypothetical protein WDU94_004878 [Cyamophila willieti]